MTAGEFKILEIVAATTHAQMHTPQERILRRDIRRVRHARHGVETGLDIDSRETRWRTVPLVLADIEEAAEYVLGVEPRPVRLDLPDPIRPERAADTEIAHRIEREIGEQILDGPVVGAKRHPAADADGVTVEPEILQHDVAVAPLAEIEPQLGALPWLL